MANWKVKQMKRRIFMELKKKEQMGRLLRNMSMARMGPIHQDSGWVPSVDIYETEIEFIVLMDASGIDPNQLSVLAERKAVTVSGHRRLPAPDLIYCTNPDKLEILKGPGLFSVPP
ncbi:MAG: hypothetical protein U9O82_11580 [Thermodesulfobacteriota bacterium]|nr:hypothetical protein [Thermodesulfobacteriota bacterium]